MKLENAIEQLTKCLCLKDSDKYTLLADASTIDIVSKIRNTMQSIATEVAFFNLDDYKRPILESPNEIANALNESTLLFYAIDKVEEEFLFRRNMCETTEGNALNGRAGFIIPMTEEILTSVFNCNMTKVNDLTDRLFDYMLNVESVNVTTDRGTDLKIEFASPPYNWVKSNGMIEGKGGRNAMPAEVFTYPINVNGVICIDGIYSGFTEIKEFKENISSTLQRHKKTPILWNIQNGFITDVYCEDYEMEKIVENIVFERCENSNIIGEYGMGTNLGIKKFIGVIIHDEKYPGFHLGHGNPLPERTNAPFKVDIHYDAIVQDAKIVNNSDKKIILSNGIYRI